jgi:hypothetical protein
MKEFLKNMTKKECKNGQCRVNIPDLDSVDKEKREMDKKDSSKRLR